MKTKVLDKHKRFVQEYLIDLNGTQAAIRAGYSPKTAEVQSCRLLRYAKIQEYLQKAMLEREKRTEITQDKVLKELAKLGFSDIRKAVAWGKKEHPVTFQEIDFVSLIPSDQIDDDTAAAITEVKQGASGEVSIKLSDKRAALVDIGKHLGMFEKKEDTTKEETSITVHGGLTVKYGEEGIHDRDSGSSPGADSSTPEAGKI